MPSRLAFHEGHALTFYGLHDDRGGHSLNLSYFLECRVKLVQDMTGEQMDGEIAAKVYPESDFHTIFMGEIVACYTTDE